MNAVTYLLFCFFFFFSTVFASFLDNIANSIESGKLNLQNCVNRATAVFEKGDEIEFDALERISRALLAKNLNLRKCSYIVDFSKAVAKFAMRNMNNDFDFNMEMPNTALLMIAIGSAASPEHEVGLAFFLNSLYEMATKQSLISRAAKFVDLSSFIWSKSAIFSSKDFLEPVVSTLFFDRYLTVILADHPNPATTPHEHIFQLFKALLEAKVPLDSITFAKYLDFFQAKFENSSSLFEEVVKTLFFNFPEISVKKGCSKSSEVVKKFIYLLLNDRALALMTEKDFCYVGRALIKLQDFDSVSFNHQLLNLTTGRAIWNQIEAKREVIKSVSEWIRVLFMQYDLGNSDGLAFGKYGAVIKLERIVKNPSNHFVTEAVADALKKFISFWNEALENPQCKLYKHAVCCCADTVKLILLDQKNKHDISWYCDLFHYLKLVLELKGTVDRGSQFMAVIESIDDVFLEDMFAATRQCSNFKEEDLPFVAEKFENFIHVIRAHTNPERAHLMITDLFADFLIKSGMSDYRKMYYLHQKYPEIDVSCLLNALAVINDKLPEKSIQHYNYLLMGCDLLSESEAQLINLFVYHNTDV